MDDLQLLISLHKPALRQGPGGEAETRHSLELAGLDRSRPLKLADIGCGTGASTIQLAKELDAQIVAVDFLPEFLDELQARAHKAGVAGQITPMACSMEALPFAENEFDVIWSEGAIYNMGFEAGVAAWRRFLKPGGILVLSEITWLSTALPQPLQTHWQREYPEIGLASAKIAALERHGYSLLGYFPQPSHCWLENYYRPMQERFSDFLQQHEHSAEAQAIVAAKKNEIALYEQYSDYFSYGVYVSKKM